MNIRVKECKEGYLFNAEDIGRILCKQIKKGVEYVRFCTMSKCLDRNIKKGDFINDNELKKLIEVSRSEEKAELTKYLFENNYIKETFVHTQTRFEISFMRGLEKVLYQMNIDIEFQKHILDYRLDAYIPRYNLAIEYDEQHHQQQQKEDKQREEEIKKILGCKFIRLDYKDDDFVNIGKVLKAIM